MAKLLSTIIDGFLSSKTFVSGALGSGWRIWKRLGRWIFEVDDLVVRNTMTVFELLIQKIRAVKGALAITQASGKIKSVREDDDNYYITIEDEMSFMANDIIKCQTFSSGQKNYWVIVSDVANDEIVILKTEFEGSSLPSIGDEIVQFGNTTDTSRQSAIYLHADEGGQPAIDVLFGINSKSFDGKTKIRIGGAIPGSTGMKGFYCENGMIKSVNPAGEEMYILRPDGSGFIAKGNISWDADGNGSIFNKAIYWDTDGFHFGNGIKLTWDNLDETAKENLKGNDGISIIWKGDLSSHPSNPKDGWAYKNTITGKSYIYQDNGWYVMTVDGIDGDDGLSIVWKGDLVTPPLNPLKNWAYRDTDNGKVYIYDGLAWSLMVVDGSDGANGHGVFITYHDSESEPVKPTGNGTAEGWHTNSTASVVWMSQKVAENASSGEWGDPINFKGRPGADANLLPWVEEWNNNKTEISGNSVISPKMFSGIKGANGKLTGVAFGRGVVTIVEDGVEKQKTGIYGLKNGIITFSIDEDGNSFYGGEINVNNNFKVNVRGELECTGAKVSGRMSTPFVSGDNTDIWNTVLKDNYNIFANLITAVSQNIFLPYTGMNGVHVIIFNFDPTYSSMLHLDLQVFAPDAAYRIPGGGMLDFAQINIIDLSGNGVRYIYVPYGKAAELVGVGENDDLYCWKLLSLS